MNVMLDLETLGTKPGCAILAIGMVAFEWDRVLPTTFYHEINTRSCLVAGLTIDPETEKWWRERDGNQLIHRASFVTTPPLAAVLVAAKAWIELQGPLEQTLVWGNGADFDLPILAHAYTVCGFGGAPWLPYAGRCYRTLKNLRPEIKIVRQGDHHNALDDARSQAVHAMTLGHIIGVPQ